MSDLTRLVVSTDYVDAPKADDFVHADLLKVAINDEIVCCINSIIDRMNILTGTDNKLKDNSVLLRMLAAEVKEVLPGITYFFEARLATTAPVILAGLQTVDDLLAQDGDLILVKDQVDATQNGLYLSSTSVWMRLDPMVDEWRPDGVSHTWVSEGTQNSFTSWIWSPPQSAEVGTAVMDWTLFHAAYKPIIDADIQDALQGTEGAPDNVNRFVTDSDTRLDVFTDLLEGLVPPPGASVECARYLCEDGTWAIPDAAIVANAMQRNITNNMTVDGIIVFQDTRGVRGLASPSDDGDAVNKLYVDTITAAIQALLGPLVAWKVDLDALNGVILCDGAGAYSSVPLLSSSIPDDSTFGGGLQPVSQSIDLLVNSIGGVGGVASAAKAVTDALDALTGIIVGAAGTYSGIPFPGGVTKFLREDGTFVVPTTTPVEYGELYRVSDTVVCTTQNTWYQFSAGWTVGLAGGFTPVAAGTITYTGTGGLFRALANLSGVTTNAIADHVFEAAFFVNGVLAANTVVNIPELNNGASDGRHPVVSGLLNLSTGDVVTLRVRCTDTNTINFITDHINVTLK